jgi:hypothetical protein
MPAYVGIDVHRKRSQVAVTDQEGQVLANRNAPNGVEPILGVLGGLPPGTPTAVEAARRKALIPMSRPGSGACGHQGRLQGGHRGIGSHPGGERGGVGAVELPQGDAIKRHLRVVRSRLQLPGRLLQDRVMASGLCLGHRRSSQRSVPEPW